MEEGTKASSHSYPFCLLVVSSGKQNKEHRHVSWYISSSIYKYVYKNQVACISISLISLKVPAYTSDRSGTWYINHHSRKTYMTTISLKQIKKIWILII